MSFMQSASKVGSLCFFAVHSLQLGQHSQETDTHISWGLKPSVQARFLQQPPRYFFGASTGHTGSTSLSNEVNFEGERKDEIVFSFEHLYASAGAWAAWWDAKPSTSEQLKRVRWYKDRIDHDLSRKRASTYVDLGHHNVLGLLELIPQVFGEGVMFIRMRRSRYKTAHSFVSNWQGTSKYRKGNHTQDLCNMDFRICPYKNPAHLAPSGQHWTSELWNRMSLFQQALWFVDELEAEWQSMLKRHPGLPYVECTWVDDLKPCFSTVAKVLQLNVANETQHLKRHSPYVEKDELLKKFQVEDRMYREWMNYSVETRAMMAQTDF